MNHPIPMKGGIEYDAFSGWRRYIFQRAKTRQWVKRRYWRRARIEARADIMRKLEELFDDAQIGAE